MACLIGAKISGFFKKNRKILDSRQGLIEKGVHLVLRREFIR